MSTANASPLTVWLGGADGAMFTFPAGKEATVGRGDDADIRVDATAHRQAISRVHIVLRAEPGGWVAHDRSRNGIFVNGVKKTRVELTDDTVIALGAPEGPRLVFRTTTQGVPAAHAAAAPARSAPPRPANPDGAVPSVPPPRPRAPQQPGPTVHQQPPRPYPPTPPLRPGPGPERRPPQPPPPPRRPAAARPPAGAAGGEDVLSRLTGVVKKMVPARTTAPVAAGDITIGRADTCTVVVNDPLVSRVHAVVSPAPGDGWRIRDNGSRNGTFVNGVRVSGTEPLRAGDTIAVGNVDLMFDGRQVLRRVTERDYRGITVHNAAFAVDGHQLLADVSVTARPGTLTAVIGPSGAGKSTLIKLISGQYTPTAGAVSFDGHNLHAEFAALRSRIGVVPQDDVVHRQLTVEQALRYAAELRLPPDTTRADREALIDRVLAELGLTEHRRKRVDQLSGGQRKRASVAMELLTGPSVLILDEPTSGLDPALDRQVMTMLRQLADAGRVVIVVTHSLTYLGMCDQVLLLAPGGRTAYAGPPKQVSTAMGTDDWADVFSWVSSDPDGAHRAHVARAQPLPPPPPVAPAGGAEAGAPARTSTARQMVTVARRQFRLLVADRGYFAFLAVLPFLLGVLALVVPGDVGLGMAAADGDAPGEPNQLLVLCNIAAVFMGTALTIRDLVGERNIFRREQSVGLSAGAYLAAKVVVYALIAAVQAAVFTAIVVAGKGGPQSAVLLGNPDVELYVAVAATTVVSAMVGLALSSLARTGEQILPMLVAVVFLSIVFAGGMIPITGRAVLEQLSWFLPARWGFAASAATVDLLQAAPLLSVDDPLWRHSAGWWLLDMGILLAWGAVAVAVALARIRLRSPDAEPAPGRRWLVVAALAVLLVGYLGALTYLTRDGGPRQVRPPGAIPELPAQGPAPEQEPVPAGELAGLLLTADELAEVMDAPGLGGTPPSDTAALAAVTAAPPQCLAVVAAGAEPAYRGLRPTGVAGRTVADGPHTVTQFAVGFAESADAARYFDQQINGWRDCAEQSVTIEQQPPRTRTVGEVDPSAGVLRTTLTDGDGACQRVLTTDANVVVDVLACAPEPGRSGQDIATRITDKIA